MITLSLDNFVSLFDVIPIDSEIARIGGLYKRDFGKSHGVRLADAIIAAGSVFTFLKKIIRQHLRSDRIAQIAR